MNDAEARQRQAAESLEAMVAKKLDAKPRKFRATKDQRRRAIVEMDAMAESGDWSAAKGHHLVALYAWCHNAVYGVEPLELDSRAWAIAGTCATRMVEQHFDQDPGKAIEFMRWAWDREREREEWRRANGRSGRRIGWQLQFSGSLITDWKLDIARRAK
jgi:hypothetical protein